MIRGPLIRPRGYKTSCSDEHKIYPANKLINVKMPTICNLIFISRRQRNFHVMFSKVEVAVFSNLRLIRLLGKNFTVKREKSVITSGPSAALPNTTLLLNFQVPGIL